MTKAPLYNQEGKKIGEVELPPTMFEIPVKPEIVHQAILNQNANARRPLAHTKTRGEVRGGGKKPWRQKGTGRARHGSIRSPIWKGGGIVFGPRASRNFHQVMTKKLKRKSLMMALSDRAKYSRIAIVKSLDLPEAKTRMLRELLKKIPIDGKNILLIMSKENSLTKRAARNLSGFRVCSGSNLNTRDIIASDALVIEQAGLEKIKETYGNSVKSKKL